MFNIHALLGDGPSRLDLPDVKVLACLVLPLALALVHLVQLQHSLTGLCERNDQLAHTSRLHKALSQTRLVVGNIVCQFHTPQEMIAADHVSACAEHGVVCEDNLGQVPVTNLGQVCGFVVCFEVS